MFLINSRLGLVTATPEGAPLLPKLRGHFAEFLRESYLALLSILYLPTCVGLGYRCKLFMGSTSFSWKYDIMKSRLRSGHGLFCPSKPRTLYLVTNIQVT